MEENDGVRSCRELELSVSVERWAGVLSSCPTRENL
jgi:hypothetical protein